MFYDFTEKRIVITGITGDYSKICGRWSRHYDIAYVQLVSLRYLH